jgi:hypothetical protein
MDLDLNLPFWFKQRQCKAEPVGDNTLKVTGPNLGEAYVYIRQDRGHWAGGLRLAPEGPDVAVTDPELPGPKQAWDAAFELYRTHFIV